MPFLLAQFELAAPAWLIGLVALVPLGWLAWASATRFSLAQRLVSFACRALILLLVLLALAGLTEHWQSDLRRVVLLVDESASISESAKAQAEKYVADAMAARGSNEVVVAHFADSYLGSETKPANNLQTDIAAGLRGAYGEFDPDFVPEVVLLSDGRPTRGDLLATVAGMRVPVSTVPLGPSTKPEIYVAELSAEPRSGQTIVRGLLRANSKMTGLVKLLVDGEIRANGLRPIEAGDTHVEFSVPAASDPGKLVRVCLELERFPDTDSTNNRRTIFVASPPKSTVLILSGTDRAGVRSTELAGALRANGYQTKFADTRSGPQAGDLTSASITFLDGPSNLSPPQWAELRKNIEERGMGLVVLGGPKTFAADKLAGSPLEAIAPVKAQVQTAEREKVLALMLVIDRSQSMLDENRLALAKAAAKRAVEVLAPTDRVGIIAFGSEVEWIVEPGPAKDRAAILAKIDALEAEGLTNMFPALQRAALAVEQTRADRKHLIVLTDGVPSPGDFGAVARELAAAGVTVTTVSISAGAEQSLLKEIARLANGRHRHAANPADLTGILEQETKAAATDLAGVFTPSVYRRLPRLDIEGMPTLDGGVATSPKPGSELLLIADRKNPLLSWWRLGRGTVVAFAAEPTGERAEAFAKWPGYGPFLARLAQHAEGPMTERSEMYLRAEEKTLVASIALPPGETAVSVSVQILDGKETVTAKLVAPGRYEARFPSLATGEQRVQARIERESGEPETLIAGWIENYPDELQYGPPDEALLKHVAAATGGKFNPTPEQLFTPDDRRVDRTLAWWPRLLIVALLLFVIDVALKRYAW